MNFNELRLKINNVQDKEDYVVRTDTLNQVMFNKPLSVVPRKTVLLN